MLPIHLMKGLASRIREIYMPGYAFPSWVLDYWDNHHFDETIVFYHKGDNVDNVKLMATQREPCNIGMKRYYDREQLQALVGWKTGAYGKSTVDKLMPNIAVYCNATVCKGDQLINVHVINLVGHAFDNYHQPDYKYFSQRDEHELITSYRSMWRLALACVEHLKDKIDSIMIYNVGGGAFAGRYGDRFITDIFEPSFLPLLGEFKTIKVLGYDIRTKEFNGGFIPDTLQHNDRTLYVNAWDPWSLIGNGNEMDNSLDGYWGRNSNMAVLGWPVTNPQIKYVSC